MTCQTKPWSITLAIVIIAGIVGGGVYYWNAIDSIDIIQAEPSTTTYTSSEFKYSLSYSEDWLIEYSHLGEAQPELVRISKKETKEGMVASTELTISVTRSSVKDNTPENIISREDVTFAGQPATKINFTSDFGQPLVSILIQQNYHTFVISYDPEYEDIAGIETILDSFAFADDLALADTSVSQDIVYTNAKYGFTLKFPQTWEGYTAKNRELTWGSDKTDSIDYGFDVQDSIFNISVMSQSQWKRIGSEEGPRPVYLGENSEYVFGYGTAQDVVNNTMMDRMAEVKSIIKTFVVQQ